MYDVLFIIIYIMDRSLNYQTFNKINREPLNYKLRTSNKTNSEKLPDNFLKLKNYNTCMTEISDDIFNKLEECNHSKSNKENEKLQLRPRTAFSKANPLRMKQLRNKFIERALSYQGVPYNKKYFNEDEPLYNSPLFLDCCALVRQCVNDLSYEFGFRLGRWNQAYQFDILPNSINFEDLQPGDLIFYEATHYKDKGWKDQPHNMVHVEIYLGDYNLDKNTPATQPIEKSERTIAAREKKGVVQIFDTYKFTSENYYDIKFHFKSLDNWLKGIHKSYCKQHEWYDHLQYMGKGSLKNFHV